MAKSHEEYVQEVVGGLTEVHCCAPNCEAIMGIDVASHVDLRQLKGLVGHWSKVNLASLEKEPAYFCKEHQRLLLKAFPGTIFASLDKTIQFLAQYRRTQAIRDEEHAAEEKRRQEQVAAEQAKVEAMRVSFQGRLDPMAGPLNHRPTPINGGCRQQVLDGRQAAALRRQAVAG